jgi:hypothetical protein
MEKLYRNGKSVLAENEVQLEGLLESIPPEHRGLKFERVLDTFAQIPNTSTRELAFATEWAWRNTEVPVKLLDSILAQIEPPIGRGKAPKTTRDWQVARTVSATIIQWLATREGRTFLEDASRRAGDSVTFSTIPVALIPYNKEEKIADSTLLDFDHQDD